MLKVLFSRKGRIRRRDFWLWGVSIWLVYAGCVIDGGLSLARLWTMTPGHGRLIVLLAGLPVMLWMSLSLWTKRFHDRGRPMWDLLHILFPIRGWIWGMAEFCSDGTPSTNCYGPSPKGLVRQDEVF